MSNGNFGLYGTSKQPKSKFDFTPFIRVPFKLLRLLSRDSALVLSYLMNHETKVASRYAINGRFYVTQEQFEHECKMRPRRQQEIMSRLERKEFIRSSFVDGRWIVRIRYAAINKAADRLD